MQPTDIFRDVLKGVAIVLKEHGYSRKGNTFYIRKEGNWGLVNLQKSRKSSAPNEIFTINLGVCLQILVDFFAPEKIDEKPQIEDCHWRQRIGFLLPGHNDKWWSVTNETSIEQLVPEIQDCLLNSGVPEIDKLIGNEGLQSLWLSGQSPGLTDVQRLMNLSVLLKTSGASSQLETVLHQLEKVSETKPTALMVRQHVHSLQGKVL